MKRFNKWFRNTERGQAILIIAFAMVGLVAFVGLMTDGGVLLIEYGKLKRGIDAAAVAASQQFRRGFNGEDLAAAARNFLVLNESDATEILIYRCKEGEESVVDGTLHDVELCTTPRRKLVRVEAKRMVNFGFLRILGITQREISATSVGEAGSIDLVLVIDTSASMAYDTYTGPNARPDLNTTDGPTNDVGNPVDDEDPAVCNISVDTPCQPLEDVKNVAQDFLQTMYFPYDRVAVVAFTGQELDGTATRQHVTVLPLSDTENDVRDAIESLKVFRPPDCVKDGASPDPDSPTEGLCRNLNDSGVFIPFDCARLRHSDFKDLSSCNSSNIGGALTRAWSVFTVGDVRPEAVWVTILLAGGPANATDTPQADQAKPKPPLGWTPEPSFHPFGFCPSISPPCRDGDASNRNAKGSADYDADDFARDSADAVADPTNGGGITIYTIGLGNLIKNSPVGDPDEAEKLLEYIAEDAGGSSASHGLYFYAPNSDDLAAIFEKIANDIFTKIAK